MKEKRKKDRVLYGIRKRYSVPGYALVVFCLILLVSLATNMRFLYLQQYEPAEFKNIPFEGRIIENNQLEIVVAGCGDNLEKYRGTYIIHNSDQIKIVDENEQNLEFKDLKPDMYVEVRLWDYGFETQDMGTLTTVTQIKCAETRERLHEEM